MKKLIYIFVPVLLLLNSPSKADAYWQVAGIKVPTSFSEIKQIFSYKPKSTLQNTNKVTTTVKTESEQSNVVTETFVSNTSEEQKTTEQINETDNSWTLTISQSELNRYIDDYLVGQSFAGYTVDGGEIQLQDQKALIQLVINTNYKLDVELTLDTDGKNLQITKLENAGEKKFSGIELLAIRQFVNNIKKLAFASYPEYKEQFNRMYLESEKVLITFNDKV